MVKNVLLIILVTIFFFETQKRFLKPVKTMETVGTIETISNLSVEFQHIASLLNILSINLKSDIISDCICCYYMLMIILSAESNFRLVKISDKYSKANLDGRLIVHFTFRE